MSEVASLPRFNVKETFFSLKYPNYRLWFIGQLVSLVGTWMQSAAQGYLIYELTKSPVYLGYVSFANGIPTWIFTLYAGLIADRLPRRTLMVITQTAMMILAFVLAALTFSHLVQPWHILILSLLLGVANSFDAPARQAFVTEMVDRDAMTNAIALNSTMFTSAVVLGPAFGGLTYGWLGPGWCFILNGISFIAVIIALLLMKKLNPVPRISRNQNAWKDIREGLKYTLGHSSIRTLITNLGVTTLFGVSLVTLLPAWSVEILGGDATTNGFLLSARGIGALAGALMIAALGRAKFRGRLWTYASFALPLTMFLFAGTRWLPLSLLAIGGIGWTFTSLNNTTNAMVQTQVTDELRGRVMGIYTMVFFGAMPLGSLLVGFMAERVGEQITVLINSVILLVFAVYVVWREPEVRQTG